MATESDTTGLLRQLIKAYPDRDPDELATIARSIVRAGKPMHRIAERFCSEEMSDRTTARLEREDKRLEAIVLRQVAKLPGASVDFNGDPRGFPVKVKLPTGRGNTWGGDACGWGVG